VSIALIAPGRDIGGLAAELRVQAPGIDIEVWPDLHHPDRVEFAVCWNPPSGVLASLPSLKAATSLGAGVDGILKDPGLPEALPLGRLSGRGLGYDMAGWLLAHINSLWFDLERFARQQRQGSWQPWSPKRSPRVGLLGTGTVAQPLIRASLALGFEMHGWNRSGVSIDGLIVHSGQTGLTRMASRVDFLICLLPLTLETSGILDIKLFDAMAPDSVLINAGRGEHLVEEDLLAGLDRGRPVRAILDVFGEEPLPPRHAFWRHPAVTVSPHCAAVSQDQETAGLILESYRRVRRGETPSGLVDRERGY